MEKKELPLDWVGQSGCDKCEKEFDKAGMVYYTC